MGIFLCYYLYNSSRCLGHIICTILFHFNSSLLAFQRNCCMKFLPGIHGLFMLILALVHAAFDIFKKRRYGVVSLTWEIVVLMLYNLFLLELIWPSGHISSLDDEFAAVFLKIFIFLRWLFLQFFLIILFACYRFVFNTLLSTKSYHKHCVCAAYYQSQCFRVCSTPAGGLLSPTWSRDRDTPPPGPPRPGRGAPYRTLPHSYCLLLNMLWWFCLLLNKTYICMWYIKLS